ncbi:hypothetical protein LOK49_LG01G00114 [Camellia lanceoleosa]|uniref:Uncharacterized protein n=1 Tax=Camellia lanceoleosa TaxID=1840588 RepID=A0ACC0IXI8_9ERIC|nr:hypothetical protein LOK49_LG01G00114 [Camellia lanceoleosa]
MLMAMHEGFMKDDLDQEDFCVDGSGIQSIHGEDVDRGYFGGCHALAKFRDYGETDDFLDESLDGDDHNKDLISAMQESNFDTVILFNNASDQEQGENHSLGLIQKGNEGTNGNGVFTVEMDLNVCKLNGYDHMSTWL